MIEGTNKKAVDDWNTVFSGKKILSDTEALKLDKLIRRIRKEYGFRKKLSSAQ